MDDEAVEAFPDLVDPSDSEHRDHEIFDLLSVIRANAQMVARSERLGQPLTGQTLGSRMAVIDQAVVRVAALLRGTWE